MDKYHVGIDLAKGDDLGCCVIKKGATLLVEFFGPRCEEQALQWLLTRMDATDAGLAAARMELSACQNAIAWALGENGEFEPDSDEPLRPDGTPIARYWWRSKLRKMRVAELLAQEGVPAQPQYREPTLEDARELWNKTQVIHTGGTISETLSEACKQLGFYRKVQP